MTGNYAPFTYSTALLTNPGVLGTYDASDPLMAGVTALSTNFRLGISAASGSTVVASWNDAVPAVAVRRNGVIGINAYLGAGATWSGQFGHLIVNGSNLFCVTPFPPPPPPPPPPPAPKCKVPRVIGLTVAKATAKLKRAHCKVGTIRRAHSRKVGRVIRQSPRPGLTKPNGFEVELLVGRR